MDLKFHIGHKVKAARRVRRLTQEQLAEKIGRAVETVSNIERGSALTGLDTLQQIGRALEMPMSFFFEDVEDERPVSRKRLEAEEQLKELVKRLRDDDVFLALAMMKAAIRERYG